ncbi:hypothetical protein [Salinisphaera orenii]|uniref:hypothetical protein n=1 Tax=Salinisphaera orenii TaxID=856731 RepID=UPI000DBE2AFB
MAALFRFLVFIVVVGALLSTFDDDDESETTKTEQTADNAATKDNGEKVDCNDWRQVVQSKGGVCSRQQVKSAMDKFADHHTHRWSHSDEGGIRISTVYSQNEIKGHRAELIVMEHPEGQSVTLSYGRETLQCDTDRCPPVAVKFDYRALTRWHASGSNVSMRIKKTDTFIDDIKRASTAAISLPLRVGSRTFRFDLEGYDTDSNRTEAVK